MDEAMKGTRRVRDFQHRREAKLAGDIAHSVMYRALRNPNISDEQFHHVAVLETRELKRRLGVNGDF